MDYEIVNSDRNIGQIQVAYKNAKGQIIGTYAVDVPIVDGRFITGDALHSELLHRAPTWLTTRETEVAAASNFDEIEALVRRDETVYPTDSQKANIAMWEKTQFEGNVAEVLVKFGLLDSNPTTIGVTVL